MRYGIYNKYAEEWWRKDNLQEPVLFKTKQEAKDYLTEERKRLVIDSAEGVVMVYRGRRDD